MAVPPVPEAVLRRTPSQAHGVRRSVELHLRAYGAELILRATVLLRLPQLTGVSAAAILQRFYYRRSLLEFDVSLLAPAALLLACKLEETHRTLRDIAMVFHRLRMRTLRCASGPAGALYAGIPTSGPSADDAAELKQAIIAAERHILRELGFVAASLLEHPHKYVLQFVKSLKKTSDWILCELAQISWNYLNDSTRTPVCCEFQPHEIACAGIFLAARKMGLRLPESPPWWAVFDADLAVVRSIAAVIAGLYASGSSVSLRDTDVAVLLASGGEGRLCRRNTGNLSPSALPPDTPFPETPAPASPQSDEDRAEVSGLRRSRSRSRSRGRGAAAAASVLELIS